jgi:hypothetical protein
LKKETDKDKSSSKKGAFYYSLDEEHYKENFTNIHNFIPRNEIPGGLD